jgi:hypothetical protein
MASKNIIQSVKVVNEPFMVNKHGKTETYIPREIVGHREAYAASLHLLFKHVADFHVLMIEILAEKYSLSADEMVRVCHEDERFQKMVVNPTIHAMSYFDENDAAKKVAVASDGEAVVTEAKPVVAKKRPIIKKTPAPAVEAPAPVVEAPVPTEEKPKPKKPVIKKKITTEVASS